MNDGDSLYRTAMPDRISLRRLIQQDAYLSDSTKGRQITGDFCARFQVPNGGRVRNFIHTGWYSSTENGYAVRALNLGLNPEASRAPGQARLKRSAIKKRLMPSGKLTHNQRPQGRQPRRPRQNRPP